MSVHKFYVCIASIQNIQPYWNFIHYINEGDFNPHFRALPFSVATLLLTISLNWLNILYSRFWRSSLLNIVRARFSSAEYIWFSLRIRTASMRRCLESEKRIKVSDILRYSQESTMVNAVFVDITMCSLVEVYWHFRKSYCLHHQAIST